MCKQSIPGRFSPPMRPGYKASYKCTYKIVACSMKSRTKPGIFSHRLTGEICSCGARCYGYHMKGIKLLPHSIHSRLTINISKSLGQTNFKAYVGENFPKEEQVILRAVCTVTKSDSLGADNLVPPSHTISVL